MIFFSDLNPSSKTNFVVESGVEIGLRRNGENYYKIYSNSLVANIAKVDDGTFDRLFKNVSYFQTIDRTNFQMITMQDHSENNWDITEPSYRNIIESLKNTISGEENSTFMIEMSYVFKREVRFLLIFIFLF